MKRTSAQAPSLDIYCIAIGGTGMAPLACLLKGLGHRVRGSDLPLYPPMSTLLEEAGITPYQGYDALHLDPTPDLVVVGNAVPRHNLEAAEIEGRDIERISMPQALARFFLKERSPLVVAGTHGKTTISSMAAWVYTACGTNPGYLIGGWPVDLPTSFKHGSGPRFIVEGDEYNAAYFDRGPKFLHYQPQVLVLTSVEYDHADLYPTREDFKAAYLDLIDTLPEEGLLVACGDSPDLRQLVLGSRCPVVSFGLESHNDLCLAGPIQETPQGTRFRIQDPGLGEVEIHLPLWGEHNVSNALAVWAVARHDELAPDRIVEALGQFRGVKRRLEELGQVAEVVVIDDFAHHPTEVGQSLAALRRRFPRRRLVCLYEPRSLTAGRSFFSQDYETAFAKADRVHLAPVYHHNRLSENERLDLPGLAATLSQAGVPTRVYGDIDGLLRQALAEVQEGDVLVSMSSGSFEGLPTRLLVGLETAGVKAAGPRG